MSDILDPTKAAEYLGYSVYSLQLWRSKGTGPAYLKIHGRTIRYRRHDLDNWLEHFGNTKYDVATVARSSAPKRKRISEGAWEYLQKQVG